MQTDRELACNELASLHTYYYTTTDMVTNKQQNKLTCMPDRCTYHDVSDTCSSRCLLVLHYFNNAWLASVVVLYGSVDDDVCI